MSNMDKKDIGESGKQRKSNTYIMHIHKRLPKYIQLMYTVL